MSQNGVINPGIIHEWLAAKLSPQAIEADLSSKGFDKESILAHLAAFKKLRNERKQFSAFFCLGIGSLIGFISVMLSVFNPIPELYNYFLYGLTTLAILVAFWGLYLLFE